jgi:ketosteroid isomerase-like protein
MSQENVEIVRRVVEKLGSGEYDVAARELHLDAEWHNTAAFPGPSVCSGPKEIELFWTTLFETFDTGGMEIERVAESGNTVVVLIHSWGWGMKSGAPIDTRWATVHRLQGGKIVRVDVHGHWDKALEAAGLSEQDAHSDS